MRLPMSTEDIADKFRTREIDRSDPLRTLLNSLTLENIRDAAYLLAPTQKVRIKSHGTSHEEILKTKRPQAEIIQRLLEVEAQAPFKHALIANCTEPARAFRLESKVKESLTAGPFDFVVRNFLATGGQVFVTFEHTVTVKEWVEGENETIRNLEQYETRHPIVLRVVESTGLLLLSYPGFSQGSAAKRSTVIAYADLLAAVMKALESVGIETRPLPIRESLRLLMSGPNRRVHRVRADIEAANVGRFDLSSLNQKKTVEESLADLILPHMSGGATREDFIDSAKRAINDTEANFLVLYWADEAVLTRLKFWDVGCEMLFTWHGERASYRAVDSILNLLLETQLRLAKVSASTPDAPLAWLSALQGDEIVKPASFAEKFRLSATEARQELVYAVKAGMLSPVYRLNTNALIVDSLNSWTENPTDLRRSWATDDGAIVDGANPKNIEVAFRRIVTAGGRA